MIAYTATTGAYQRRTDVECFVADGLFVRPVMEAKRYKILPHLFYPDHDVTVWIDANIRLAVDLERLVREFLGSADMALFVHPFRRTVWEEFAVLHEHKRFTDIPELQRKAYAQEDAYRAAGLPEDAPLYECSVLIRRACERVDRAMEAWWAQICRWQWRDQVSLPYVLWRHPDVRVNAIVGDAREHDYFHHAEQY